MELDDLKDAWTRLDQRVGALEAVSLRQEENVSLNKSRWVLLGLTVGQVVHLAFAFALVFVAAPFWIEHRRVPHLLGAGLLLHAYGVLWICATVVQILLIGRAYHTRPVVVFQRRLVELQGFRAISTLVLGVPWWILWIVVTIVGAKRLFDIDLYVHSPLWIQQSIGIGVVGMALTVWLARRWATRPPQSPTCRRIVDDLSGSSLRRAMRELDDLARFERE